jgi:dipeptidyl aminopeptidase/acylaminoacyl peptidase
VRDRSIDVSVKQGANEPPVLIATDKKDKRFRVIWNPNPQLKDVEMGKVSVFKWKDKAGREWVGGLYKPPGYVEGKRYPLVIQTHGFDEHEFRPSGASTTAFAAQELAAVGFLVLQVRDCPIRTTPEEGPCQVAGYEAAVERLTSDGLVDSEGIGIIGFSRTCYYVMESLTTSKLHFKAASITDGINEGYLQYITNIDFGRNAIAHDAEAVIGATPFGIGLQQWLSRSPEFNMDRVTTPLLVVAPGRSRVLEMWEPYAALRDLHKPVELIVLPEGTHVMTNPAQRMASQGGTVDWFRFWFQDYEDPDPAKSEQYARWRELRKLQEQNEKKPASESVPH